MVLSVIKDFTSGWTSNVSRSYSDKCEGNRGESNSVKDAPIKIILELLKITSAL